MSIGFISNDSLNNLTNLFQRPIFIQAARIPSTGFLDVYPPGTQWGDGATPVQNIYETPGRGIWFLLGGAGGPLNTINGVAPVANNINIINQGGVGAVTVTAPGSGGPGTVGLGVNVDGVTIQIIGNQLVATAVAPPLTLTGDNGVARNYLLNNFNINGGPGSTSVGLGAIYFDSAANGQMYATSQVDNVTVQINASNQLTAGNTVIQTIGPTAAGGAFNAIGATIAIPAGSAYYFEADIIGRNGATLTNVCGGKQQCIAQNLGGVITIHGTQNQYLAENPAAPAGQQDFEFTTAVGGLALRVFGAAGIPMTFKAKISFVVIP